MTGKKQSTGVFRATIIVLVFFSWIEVIGIYFTIIHYTVYYMSVICVMV